MLGYLYKGSFFWYPSVCGNYNVTVLANCSSTGVLLGEGDATVNVAPAYNNLVVYYPGAFCGGNMSLVVAFSRARTQSQADGGGYFQTIDFAPTVVYDNCTYALDEPSQAPIIHLFLNGSETDLNDTDGSGLCSYTYNTPTLPSSLNITAAIDQNGRFQASNVSRVFNLAQLMISDDPAVASDPSSFSMSYSMSVLNGTDITYVNASNLLEMQVTVLNASACNVATSLVTGYLVNRTGTSMSVHVNIPTGCTYFRVVRACYNSSSIRNPWCNINFWELSTWNKTDISDVALVCRAFGKQFGKAGYNWTLDVDASGKIDITDVAFVCRDFGSTVKYLPSGPYSPNFDYRGISVGSDGGSVPLDSRGFGWVPLGAQWLNVSCKAAIEFYSYATNESAVTDSSGRAGVTWNAARTGVFVVEDIVRSPLNLTVAVDAGVTQMNASLCMANYYYVFNRTVDVSLSWDSQPQSTVLTACADSYIVQDDSNSYGGNSNMTVCGGYGGGQKIGFVQFDMSAAIPSGAWIVSARLNVYEFAHSGVANYTVHMVDGTWDEQTLDWFNRPDWNATASCTLSAPSQDGLWLSFDVTSDVRSWYNGSNANHGSALLGDPASSSWIGLRSKEYADYLPSLEVCYLNGSQHVCVSTYDEAKHCPAPGMNVNFTVNGNFIGSSSTNDSGVWDAGPWSPSSGGMWNLGASSSATGECTAGSTSTKFNIGLPTSMVSLDDGSDLSPGTIVSNFSLCSSGLFNVSGVTVNFCLNGTLTNGTRTAYSNSSITLANGTVRFGWNAGDVGTFSVNATFMGDTSYAPCEVDALAAVSTLPLSVLFSVSPSEFAPPNTVTLNATIINPLTGSVYTTHPALVEFSEVTASGHWSIGDVLSENGSAVKTDVSYVDEYYAQAYSAQILSCEGTDKVVQSLVSSPVQLSVGWNTTLALRVLNTSSPSQYLIDGWLKSDGEGLEGRIVAVNVNGSCVDATSTDGSGYFSCTRDFSLGGAYNSTSTAETATYTITASYEGGWPLIATAYANTLDGTSYAQCTTIQYGHKPSSNSTVLTVTPQSALATTLTKTPEEMQEEAKSEGLQLWGPDSFWFLPPFFKLHAKVTVDSSGSNVQNWVGLFACGVDSLTGITVPLQKGLENQTPDQIVVATGVVTSVAAAVAGLYLLNFMAAVATQVTLGLGLFAVIMVYSAVVLAAIVAAKLIPDSAISRAALYGIGFALLALVLGGFAGAIAATFPAILKGQLTGSDPAKTAGRSIMTTFLSTQLTAGYILAANILFLDMLMWPFAIATFVLAVLAIYWGSIR